MKISVPFGYDAVGKLERERLEGHLYLIGWHEVVFENLTRKDVDLATRWNCGETFLWNGRHYAATSVVPRPGHSPATPWLSDIGADDIEALTENDFHRKQSPPALTLVTEALSPNQRKAFAPFERGQSRADIHVVHWNNQSERRHEIEEMANAIIFIDGKAHIEVDEPVFEIISTTAEMWASIKLTSPHVGRRTGGEIRRDHYRCDRYDDLLSHLDEMRCGRAIRNFPDMIYVLEGAINGEDDLNALERVSLRALECGERFLPKMTVEQAMTWYRLRDEFRIASDPSHLLKRYVGVLQQIPGDWQHLLQDIEAQLSRWNLRPITSCRAL